MLRAVRTIFGLGVVLAVATPALRNARDDSYPLSTYPMFARVIDQPLLTFAEGVTKSGQVLRLPPAVVASDEPMQAMRTLRLSAEEGEQSLRSLCSKIASRAARLPAFSQVKRVRIQRARFDPLRYFDDGAVPPTAELLMQCRVRR